MKRCPYCGWELSDDARACGNCGRPVPESVVPEQEVNQTEAPSAQPKPDEVPDTSAQPEDPGTQQTGQTPQPSPQDQQQNTWDPQQNGWNAQAEGWNRQDAGYGMPQQNGWYGSPQAGPGQQNSGQPYGWGRQYDDRPYGWGPQNIGQPYGRDPQGGSQPYRWEPQPQRARTNGFAMASLWLGIAASILNGMIFIPSILAIIFGLIGLVQTRRNREQYSGGWMAVAGIILGVIFLIVYAVVFFRVYHAMMENPDILQQIQHLIDVNSGIVR